VSPALGTVSSSGLYAAPATVSLQQTVTVKAVLTSNSAVSVTAAVTLTPSSTSSSYSVAATVSGSSLKVTWTAPSGASSYDYVTLASPGGPNWWYLWSGNTKGATSGSFTVATPSSPGLYQFRYYKGNGTLAATSSTLAMNVSAFSVTASPATVSMGGEVTVSWTAPAGRPGNWGDRIGLYKAGTSSDEPISYIYPQGSAGGTTSGTYTLRAPSTSGSYELRYVLTDGTYIAAVITPLTVQSSGSSAVSRLVDRSAFQQR
jgi:hypothetical protein